MKYLDGQAAKLGDQVDWGGGMTGVVVCCFDEGLFSPVELTQTLGLLSCLTREGKNNPSKFSTSLWAYDGFSSESDYSETEWRSLEVGLLFLLPPLWPTIPANMVGP